MQTTLVFFMRIRRFLFSLLCAGLLAPACAEPPPVMLAQDGQARLTISLIAPGGPPASGPGASAGPADLLTASLEDLRVYLDKLGGAPFTVETIAAYPGADKPGIFVGRATDLAFAGLATDRQQYGLRTTAGGQLLIAGADARGLSHAIYALLHQLGCRWYFPGEIWSVAPEAAPTLRVAVDRVDGPDFFIQRRIWVGHGLHSPTTRHELAEWYRRNGLAQPFDVAIAHSWIGLDAQRDFADHPEWFALVRGARKPAKPCYSHPDVIAKAAAYALRHFEQKPDSGMVSVSAPDGLDFCACERCRQQARVAAVSEAHGVLFGKQPDGREVSLASETIFAMANQVARAVADRYPGKRVGIMAYSGYAHPPSFPLESNIYVEVTAGYRRTPLTLPEQMTAFGAKATALGVYEYYDVEQWSWDQPGKARASQLDAIQAATRFYFANNVRSLSGEMSNNFGPNGIGYYAIARLLWDAATDVRALEQEFYRDCFGPAAEPIRRLYRRWESGQGFDDRALALAYRDLDEAAKRTADSPARRARVDRLRLYARFLKNFLQVREGSQGADMEGWKKQYGEEGARKRAQELGTWASRLIDTHMIHGWAFNRYFVRRGDAMGLDTQGWNKAGPIPDAGEIERLFQQDLAELAPIEAREVPAALFSRQLVSLDPARQPVPGTNAVPARAPNSFRKGALDLFAEPGQPVRVAFAATGTTYSLLFTPKAIYEDGGGSQYSTRFASGTLEDAELQLAAPAPGYFTLQWNDATIRQLDHPHALRADQLQFGSGEFFFFVPRETERFIVQAQAHGGPSLVIRDPAGRVMLDVKPAGDNPQTRFLVEVPAASAGGVWSITGPGCVNRTGSIRFIGLPPYLALAPHRLMVPREALP